MRQVSAAPRAAAALGAAAVLASCGGSSGSGGGPSGSFVGLADNGRAAVMVLTDGTNARAYICDGRPGQELTVDEWFKGAINGNDLDLQSLSGIAHLTAHVTQDGVTGTITVPLQPDFHFTAAPGQGSSGFYLYKNIHTGFLRWAGWIVLPSGDIRGSQVTPVRTSIGVSLDPVTGRAQIPAVGAVTPLKGDVTNLNRMFNGCTTPACG